CYENRTAGGVRGAPWSYSSRPSTRLGLPYKKGVFEWCRYFLPFSALGHFSSLKAYQFSATLFYRKLLKWSRTH
uniref:hypothetical protein n=1 Tax=Roseivirga sp. TaxID=1964215 RepID=UPI00404755B7